MSGSKVHESTLLAVYDFAVARIAFDFFGFLVVAERARRRAGLARLSLLIVPADGDGFHPNVQYDLAHKRWRLFNLVLQGAAFLPSLAGVALAGSREDARARIAAHRGSIHPAGYTVDTPKGQHHLGWSVLTGHLGDDVQVLHASAQARAYARTWLDERAGQRLVVALTLREASFNAQRNSRLEDWTDFARHLQSQGYFPVVLRDIERALDVAPPALAGIGQFPEAVFNLDLRLALYEHAYLNLFVANGPAQLAFYDRAVRLICFVTGEWNDERNPPHESYGIGYGETPPFLNRLQRWVWREPSADALAAEFDAMRPVLDAAADAPVGGDPARRLPLTVVARRFLKAREWDLLAGALAEGEQAGCADAELRALAVEGEAQRRSLDRDTEHLARARRSRDQGNLDEAIELLHALVQQRSTEIEPLRLLGACFEEAGRLGDAYDLYKAAVARSVATPDVVYRLGCLAQRIGNIDEARACFEILVARGAHPNAREHLARLEAECA